MRLFNPISLGLLGEVGCKAAIMLAFIEKSMKSLTQEDTANRRTPNNTSEAARSEASKFASIATKWKAQTKGLKQLEPSSAEEVTATIASFLPTMLLRQLHAAQIEGGNPRRPSLIEASILCISLEGLHSLPELPRGANDTPLSKTLCGIVPVVIEEIERAGGEVLRVTGECVIGLWPIPIYGEVHPACAPSQHCPPPVGRFPCRTDSTVWRRSTKTQPCSRRLRRACTQRVSLRWGSSQSCTTPSCGRKAAWATPRSRPRNQSRREAPTLNRQGPPRPAGMRWGVRPRKLSGPGRGSCTRRAKS